MTYLDYSATTPVNIDVLNAFIEVSKNYIGNPNSLHKLGVVANELIAASTKQIANLLNIKETEIIYTSGASESNNTALKGIALKYKNRGNRIITTEFEHSSIYGPLTYLQKEGFIVDFVKTNKDGLVDIEALKKMMSDDVILVSIGAVNSEIGIRQPIEEIGELLQQYPKCYFHVDMTQALGKINIDLKNIDLASFSAHKIYGIKGIGMLYKKDSIVLEPLVHGGKSTTIFRSGTPATALIVSFAKAIRLALTEIDKKYDYIANLNSTIKNALKDINNIFINSNAYSIPNILNISVIGIKPETMLHALEEYEIYISTQTACSTGTISKAVYSLTKDEERAKSSIRISLSSLTTIEEIEYFIKCFKECVQKLTINKE